jgi:O-antigen biosynthesis protein
MTFRVDVVIPSADRSTLIADLLESLDNAAYFQDVRFRFHVVDNCVSETESLQYENLCKKYRIAYLRQTKSGLSRALNYAITHTSEDLFILLDDDTLVTTGCLESLIGVLVENSDISYVSGQMLPFRCETDAEILFEKKKGLNKHHDQLRLFTLASFNENFRMRFPPIFFVALGGFCAFRRALVNSIGDFDVRFGCGSYVGAGNMGDFCVRAIYASFAIAHNPNAIVYHQHRRTFSGLADVRFRYAQADTAIMIKNGFQQRDWRGFTTAFLYHPWKRFVQNIRLPGYPFSLTLLELLGNFLGIVKGFVICIERRE